MEIRIEHSLSDDEVARRLASLSAKHDVEHDASARTLAKLTPLGRAEAVYALETTALVVRVTERPAFLPEGMIRRALEDKLREALAG